MIFPPLRLPAHPSSREERAPIYFLAPHRLRRSKFKEKKATPPLCLLVHPRCGGGWRAAIYFLAPHRLRGGRGPRSGEGGFADGTLPQEAIKNGATYFQRAPLTYLPFTIYNSQFSRAHSHQLLTNQCHYHEPHQSQGPFLSLLSLSCFFRSSLAHSSKDFLTVSKAFFLSSD